MTGTEIAALRLALGILRSARGGTDGAGWALSEVAFTLYSAGTTLCGAWLDTLGEQIGAMLDRGDVGDRLLRARLALYLRAVLRAERGDVSRWTCPEHPGALVQFDRNDNGAREWWCARDRKWRLVTEAEAPVRRASVARPLWLDAPPHKGGGR